MYVTLTEISQYYENKLPKCHHSINQGGNAAPDSMEIVTFKCSIREQYDHNFIVN